MARGRMISNTLGRSHKFNSLENHFHKLVYVLTLTHADAEGRVDADPVIIRADSFIRDPSVTDEQIQAALADLHRVGLIKLYSSKGRPYAEFVGFHEHNTITRVKDGPDKGKPSKEAESAIPAPTSELPEWARTPTPKPESAPEQRQSDSRPTPEQLRAIEVKGIEVKSQSQRKEEKNSSTAPAQIASVPVAQARRASPQELLDAYNANRGKLPAATALTSKRKTALDRLARQHPDALDLVIDATRHVSRDPFWRERGYNLDNLLREGRVIEKAEKHRALAVQSIPPERELSGADLLDIDAPLNGTWGKN